MSPRHNYTKSGQPAYDLGKREVVKKGNIFSVTEQLRVIANPGIAAGQKYALVAAIKNMLPPKAHELIGDWGAFMSTVYNAADEPSKIARERGTAVHNQIEKHLNNLTCDASDPCVAQLVKWVDDCVTEVFWTEAVLVEDSFRWAGKGDCFGTVNIPGELEGDFLIDWKTGKWKRNTKGILKPRWWDSYCYQLAAYRHCMDRKDEIGCLSVAICTNAEEGEEQPPVAVKQWTEAELARGLEVMNLSSQLFAILEKYDSSELQMN